MGVLATGTSMKQVQQGIKLKLKQLLKVYTTVGKLLERASLLLLASVSLHGPAAYEPCQTQHVSNRKSSRGALRIDRPFRANQAGLAYHG